MFRFCFYVLTSLFLIMVMGCNKDKANSSSTNTTGTPPPPPPGSTAINFYNATFTDIFFTLNGKTYTIIPGQWYPISGTPNTPATGSAETYGMHKGVRMGATVNWNINLSFPATGGTNYTFNVSSDYFYLYIRSQHNTCWLNSLGVNMGTSSQMVESINIPNGDKMSYGIGYYRAFSSSNVHVTSNNCNYTWQFNNVITQSGENQQVYRVVM
jgi:hypothetical protein